MLNIYNVALEVVRAAGLAAADIGRHDSDLARQLRRAATSVVLNIAEGSGVAGRNARVRYATALGSAKETRACLDAATVLGYATALDAADADKLDRVIATLTKLTR